MNDLSAFWWDRTVGDGRPRKATLFADMDSLHRDDPEYLAWITEDRNPRWEPPAATHVGEPDATSISFYSVTQLEPWPRFLRLDPRIADRPEVLFDEPCRLLVYGQVWIEGRKTTDSPADLLLYRAPNGRAVYRLVGPSRSWRCIYHEARQPDDPIFPIPRWFPKYPAIIYEYRDGTWAPPGAPPPTLEDDLDELRRVLLGVDPAVGSDFSYKSAYDSDTFDPTRKEPRRD